MFSAFSNVVREEVCPYDQDGSLVVLRQQQQLRGVEVPFSPKEVTDYREQLRQVRDVVEYHTMSFTVLGDERATRVQVGVVSNNFFSVLGIKPVVGRMFTPDDETSTAEAVVVLSHEYWMKQFAGERNVTQRFLTMNDKAHRIIGVLPPLRAVSGSERPVHAHDRVPVPFERTGHRVARGANGEHHRAARPRVPHFPGLRRETASVASRMHQTYPQSYPENAGFSTLGGFSA